MLFSVDVTLSGDIPVINPNIIYDGKKANALRRSGKYNSLDNTNAGIVHRSVPKKALIHVLEVTVAEADGLEATK